MDSPVNHGPDRALKVAGKGIPVRGCIHGFRSPVVLLNLHLEASASPPRYLSRINASLLEALPGAATLPEPQSIVELALHWTHEVQRAGGMPVFERGRILEHEPRSSGSCWVAVPSIEGAYGAVVQAFHWVLGAINAAAGNEDPQPQQLALSTILRDLGELALQASNTPRFLRAASELDIPSTLVAGRVFQFGQGAHARWLDSSFTDETPQIAAVLARNKLLGARALRRAGIPVPAHFLVKDADEALQRARELGFPVVIKPGDKDGGVGVAAGLASADAVRSAFAAARKFSSMILVEKHFAGRVYRVVVFRGEMIRALERTPGAVIGDGVKNVRNLIDERNAGFKGAAGLQPELKPLKFDDEARRLLAESGLTLDSVPASGATVILRSAANYARGGTMAEVFDQVHPDNRLLAVRAAAALRLDLAGVDLLMPDIRRSWLETGAAICEVNGQPGFAQAAPFLVQHILRQLVAGNGRIPIAVLLGPAQEGQLAQGIAEKLAARGLIAGWADREGAAVGGSRVAKGPLSAFAAGQILMMDKTVQAAVLCINAPAVLRSGLPFDRFDVLVVAGNSFHDATGQALADAPRVMQELLRALLPSCQGKVFLAADVAEPVARAVPGVQIVDAGDLAGRVCEELRNADARHRSALGA